MIPDNVKVSDARVQSFGFRFDFVTQPDKWVLQATNSKDNQKYVGQIPVNPCIDFQFIKEMLEEGDFKTLTKTEDLLKIRIGATVIELISISKSQIKELKETLQKSLERQFELQNTVQSQKKKIDEHELMISDLRITVEEIKSSPKVSVTVLEEMKKQMNDKLNELNENVKNEAQRNQNQLNQSTEIIQKQQNLIKQLFNRVSKIQERVDLIENKMKISDEEVQNLRKTMREAENCMITKLGDLEVTEKRHDEEIKEMKKNINQKIEKNKTAIENILIKIDKFSMIEQKVNELEFELDKRLINLKKSILTIEEIIQLIEEKKQKQIEEKKKKQIAEKKKKQIEEKKKMEEFNLKLSLDYKWSLKLKHDDFVVNQNVVTLNKKSGFYALSFLQVGFTREVREKQCWGIKIKKFDFNYDYISVGICLKSTAQKIKFNLDNIIQQEESNGCYLIDKNGEYWSHLQKKWIKVDKSYELSEGDVIIVEYDPIQWKLRFHNNRYKNKAQIPIGHPPQGDAYHPFANLCNYNKSPLSVQLIHSVSMTY